MTVHNGGRDSLSNLRKKINIKADGTEIFTPTNRGYVSSIQSGSTALSATTPLVTASSDLTTLVSASTARLSLLLQNQGVVPVLIKLSTDVSTANYSFILSAASGVRTGDGGNYVSNTWKGLITGITETGTAVVSVLEEDI